MSRGQLIAIEGIDGAGKRTQAELLHRLLIRNGLNANLLSFPVYSSFFGKLVAQYLNGHFGDLKAVDPHLSSVLYAGNRFELKGTIRDQLRLGTILVSDRYVGSNLAHQAARVPASDRRDFISWLETLEYEIFGLPKEDISIYLRIPAQEAWKLIAGKSKRAYTSRTHDIYEEKQEYLEDVSVVYEGLAQSKPNWRTIECWNFSKSTMFSPQEIHGLLGARVFEQLGVDNAS